MSADHRRRQRKAAALRRLTGRPGRPHHVPAHGTARRLRALRVIGHPTSKIGAALRVSRQMVGMWCKLGPDDLIDVKTRDKVAALYDRWAWMPGGDIRAANLARKQGWRSPLAWDDIDDPAAAETLGSAEAYRPARRRRSDVDEVRVLLCMGGSLPVADLTRTECDEVIRRLNETGLDDQQICRRTGVGQRQILRIRTRLGIPATRPIARAS